MSQTLKTILTIILIIAAAMWAITVYKSCKNNNANNTEIVGDGEGTTDTDLTAGSDSDALDDLYEDDDEEDGEGEGETDGEGDETDANAEGDTGSGATDTSDDDDEEEDDESEFEDSDDPQSLGQGSGEYLVVAGAFVAKSNAKKFVKQLERKGYNPQIRVFLGSDYHSVILGNYISRSQAQGVANKMGEQAYVHKKRYPKKRR